MKKIISIMLFLFLIIPAVSAKQGHIPLLAVRETDEGLEGSIADLYLEIQEGKGRVFLDTFPLTKVDTQISARLAKDVACSFLDIDCSGYDFIYIIKADSTIIGGPSAGAAATILTISLLDNLYLSEQIAITGTINPGGIIGPVGGLKEKVEAAAKKGMKKALIPQGKRFVKEEPEVVKIGNVEIGRSKIGNETIDLVEYGEKLGIKVVEIASLNDVIYEFTGKKANNITKELVIDASYTETMKKLAVDLCSRNEELQKSISRFKIGDKELLLVKNETINLTAKGKEAFDSGIYYSSASYCFGANVKASYLLLLLQNLTKGKILEKEAIAMAKIKDFDKKINEKQIKTITDLESYIVIKERLIEAEDYLDLAAENFNDTKAGISNLAYALERINSAYSWFFFFDSRGREFNLNKDILKSSCQDKISEAEERHEYVKLFLPTVLENAEKETGYAYSYMEKGDYELCLFKASKAKAEADIVLSVIGVEEDQLDNMLNQKLDIVKDNIIKEAEKGIFPILGYSYYEYAKTLKDNDRSSALLYSEYALELSNLDMYFEEKEKAQLKKIEENLVLVFVAGIFVGFIVGISFKKGSKPRKRQKW